MTTADGASRYTIASTAQTKLDGWQDQLAKEASKRGAAQLQIEQFEAEVAAMCQVAGCTAPENLPAAEERSKRRREFENALDAARQQLEDLAAGSPLEHWIAESEAFQSDQLSADLRRLAEEASQLDAEKTRVAEAISRLWQ